MQLGNNPAYEKAGMRTDTASGCRLLNRVKAVLPALGRTALFFLSASSLLVKSVFFLGIVNNDGTTYNSLKAFRSFDYHPPLEVYAAFVLAFLSLAFLCRGRCRYWFFVCFNLLFSCLLIVDLVCYRAFGGFISPTLFTQAAPVDLLHAKITAMLRPVDVWFVLDPLLLLLAGLIFRQPFARVKINVLLCLLLLAGSVSYIYYEHYRLDIEGKGDDSMLFRVAWVPNETMSDLSPLGYHLYDLYNFFIKDRPQKLSVQQEDEIKQWFSAKQENLGPSPYQALFKGQNVIFIQVESLENFVLNQKVNGQEITPSLNRLLQNSFHFSNFYSQVYNGTSSDADLLANTSLYPVRDGITFFRYPADTYNSLPKLLEEKGYSTLAAHADAGSHWNWASALTSIGFQKILDASNYRQDEQIDLGLSDGSFFRQTEPVISREKQPFYAYLVTLTSHGPFDLPQKYRELSLDKGLDQSKLGGYFQSIHYTDEQIGNFLTELDKSGVLDNTVVVIYGDHAGIHKYYDDEVKQLKLPQSWWLDDSQRIPLIIYHKGMKGQEITTTGGEVDILPTLASLMGIDEQKYANTAMGRNLLDTQRDFAVLADKQYVGKQASKQEEDNAVEGVSIADMIVSSDYFKHSK